MANRIVRKVSARNREKVREVQHAFRVLGVEPELLTSDRGWSGGRDLEPVFGEYEILQVLANLNGVSVLATVDGEPSRLWPLGPEAAVLITGVLPAFQTIE